MRVDGIAAGDIVKVSIKGRTGICGEVTEIKDGVVYFSPISRGSGWRHASAHQITKGLLAAPQLVGVAPPLPLVPLVERDGLVHA
jgi:hypothetical protein